jgi:hypothetical protein
MSTREPLPLELTSRPFHINDATGLGVPLSRLRATDLDAPFRGVRTLRPMEASLLNRCAAYAVLLRPDHCFSHGTAAALWGMWLPRRIENASVIDVTAVLGARAPRMAGVRGHHVGQDRAGQDTIERMLVDGVPVTSPLDTWRQLSTVLTLDELIAAGDSLVRRQHPLVNENQLIVALARHAGRRGMRLLRAAWNEVRAGADSPRETILRLILVRGGLPEPRVNMIVSRPGAARVLFGDLVYPEYRVLVEYDGEQHREDYEQYESDITRLELLANDGWKHIRVLKSHLANPRAVVRRVESALRARGWTP